MLFLVAVLVPAEASASERLRVAVGLEALMLFLVAVLVPAEASASERLRVAVGLETRLQLCLAAVLCRTKVSEALV
jgi:hypothetical protein